MLVIDLVKKYYKKDPSPKIDELQEKNETNLTKKRDSESQHPYFKKGMDEDGTIAVNGISFGVGQGECFALLGVNGAGKSSTFKCLTAYDIASSGYI